MDRHHMSKMGISLFGLIVLLILAVRFGGESHAASSTNFVGRYTIINGTPDQARNIMLLDTFTGESWISCQDRTDGTGWCHMFRSSAGTTPRTGSLP